MSELPTVTGPQAIGAFAKFQFSVVRVKGSHHQLKRPGHPFVLTVPVHGNQPIKRGTLRALIRDAGITVEQFVEALG
jgi:predicted RNA binding protein YcfA (HicA-like mRNA interferase family)